MRVRWLGPGGYDAASTQSDAIPPPQPGFPFELLQVYPMEGVVIRGSFCGSPVNGGGRATSPRRTRLQRSTSAQPSAQM
ncbi:hypothetical protein PIIN_09785 [Serendipita indica DSM 11827]|uniref:Uncharacterized protein n=1 Tax=Serendipita indica (strain DSM 11827) TaxID=1109443 RepID=G4TWV4_SERID|nr:hypothetical protein PIIN_09785 [Serendipita indica DSM 11827]